MRHPERHVVPDPHVCIAWCSPGQVSSAFMESILNLYWADANRPAGHQRLFAKGAGYLHITSGPRIASARNHLVRMFLQHHTAEWLWMIDSDMVFSPDTLDKLLEVADKDKRPIVGALAFGGGKGMLFPTMYRLCDPKENNGSPVDFVREWEPGSVVQVDGTGAACLLMHRSVLQAVGERYPEPAPWFSESVYKGHELGEDFTFCLRLMQMEIPVFVNTAASIGHMKPTVLDESVWRNMIYKLQAEGHPIKKENPIEESLTVVENKLLIAR